MAKQESSFGNLVKSPIRTKVLVLLSCLAAAGCATSGHQHSRHLAVGNDAAKSGNYVDAVASYEKALAEVPQSRPAQRNLGIVLVKIADYERALELLVGVAKEYSQDPEVHYFLGEACRGLRRFSEAAKHYQAGLRIQANDLRLIKALAWTWHKMGQNAWTVQLIEPLVAQSRGDRQLRLILASALNEQGQFDKSIRLLSGVVESNAQATGNKAQGDVQAEDMLLLTALGNAYLGKRDCARAQGLYTRVLKIRPFLDGALIGSARCHLENKRVTTAVQFLERAVKSNPESAEAHFLLARTIESSERERAVVYFSRYLELTKDSAKAFRREREVAKQSVARAR